MGLFYEVRRITVLGNYGGGAVRFLSVAMRLGRRSKFREGGVSSFRSTQTLVIASYRPPLPSSAVVGRTEMGKR